MKKILFVLALFTSMVSLGNPPSIYQYTYTTLNGEVHSFGEHSGKKILLVLLPIAKNTLETAYLRRMDSLSKAFPNLVIIGVLSYEEGYQTSTLQPLLLWYTRQLNPRIILAAGIYTRKATSAQSPLFHWLSYISENGHFDGDLTGAGAQGLVDEKGQLAGVFPASDRWNNQAYQNLLP